MSASQASQGYTGGIPDQTARRDQAKAGGAR